MSKSSLRFLSCLLLLYLSSCKSFYDVREVVPSIAFEEFVLSDLNPNKVLNEQVLQVGLRFVYKNPFSKSLVIPSHNFTFLLNGEALPLSMYAGEGIGSDKKMKQFSIPAKSEIRKVYPVGLSLNPEGDLEAFNVFGKINELGFKADFELDLTEFADQMIGVEDLLKDEKQKEAYALVKDLMKQKLGKKNFSLSNQFKLKIPAIPIFSVAENQSIRFRFTGQMETLDIGVIRDAMEPMANMLIQAADAGVQNSMITDPFVSMLNDSIKKQDVPFPLNNLFPPNKDEIPISDFLLKDIASKLPGLGGLGTHWTNFKNKYVPASGTSSLGYAINTFVDPNFDLDTHYEEFKDQWENLLDEDKFPSQFQYPGPRVTGIELQIPFQMENTNQFPITAPSFITNATLNGKTPIHFSATPVGSSTQIAAGTKRNMRLKMVFKWADIAGGFQEVLQGQSFQPDLNGGLNVDLGYGPVKVDFSFPDMPLQLN